MVRSSGKIASLGQRWRPLPALRRMLDDKAPSATTLTKPSSKQWERLSGRGNCPAAGRRDPAYWVALRRTRA